MADVDDHSWPMIMDNENCDNDDNNDNGSGWWLWQMLISWLHKALIRREGIGCSRDWKGQTIKVMKYWIQS